MIQTTDRASTCLSFPVELPGCNLSLKQALQEIHNVRGNASCTPCDASITIAAHRLGRPIRLHYTMTRVSVHEFSAQDERDLITVEDIL